MLRNDTSSSNGRRKICGEGRESPARIRREIPGELRRSWRWPDSVEKTQSDSRREGTIMAATRGGLVG